MTDTDVMPLAVKVAELELRLEDLATLVGHLIERTTP